MISNINKVTGFFKVLSDPTRLRILDLLLSKGKMCVMDIAKEVDMSHSSISHQLSKLETSEIVKSERNGQTICYEIFSEETKKKLKEHINSASS